MPSFWQVVYRYAPWLEQYIDRASAFVRSAAFKGLAIVIGCLILMVLLLPSAGAFADGAVWIAIQSDGSGIAHISAEQMQQCENEGGCDFITRERLVGEMQRAAQAVKGKYCL